VGKRKACAVIAAVHSAAFSQKRVRVVVRRRIIEKK